MLSAPNHGLCSARTRQGALELLVVFFLGTMSADA